MSANTSEPARVADKDIAGEVMLLARELKAPVIVQTFTALGGQARTEHRAHEEYLAAVLGRQVASRAVKGTPMWISATRFPQTKTLENFTISHVPTATGDVIAHLATTTFVARQENVVLLGLNRPCLVEGRLFGSGPGEDRCLRVVPSVGGC